MMSDKKTKFAVIEMNSELQKSALDAIRHIEKKEESQDELFREAALMIWSKTFVDSAMNSKEFKNIKSKFIITRK